VRSFVRAAALYGAVLGVGSLTVYLAVEAVMQAAVLQVAHVEVSGNMRMPARDVLAVLDGMRGENSLRADLDAWRRRLLASPWVRDATLRRSLPSTVEVTISERAPMAIARLERSLYLIDDRGAVIDVYGPQYADLDLPIVDGLMRGARGDAGDVSDRHNVAVILAGDPAVISVGTERFLPRLQQYVELAATLRERVADIDHVDLRFDDRIYVRPAGVPRGRTRALPTRGQTVPARGVVVRR
jgi:cell division septal protein FtsQ